MGANVSNVLTSDFRLCWSPPINYEQCLDIFDDDQTQFDAHNEKSQHKSDKKKIHSGSIQ